MMKTYPEMKESGLDWISVIPSHWETQKLKFLVSIKKDISGKLGPDVLSVTQKGIRIKDTTTGGGQLSMDYSKYQLVQTGDFVMNHMDLLTGFVDISNFEGVTSPDYRVFHITSSIQDPKYLLRNLQLCYWLKVFYGLGQGVSNLGRWRLPTEVFENFRLPLPSLPEQQQIVSFLDSKTSLIDKIIENKTQRIELLKEMRSSLISEVVTKGLNPEVPMKDLGVEWIGEIPSHWTTGKPKFLFTPVSREPEESDDVVTCFRDGTVTLRKNRREDGFTMSLQEIGYQRILPGDLVVHEMDGFEGSIGVSDSTGKSTPVYTVIPPSGDYSVRYWMYLLRVMSKSGFIESLSKGIRQRTTDFRWKMWRDQYFPLPPLVEQQQIVSFLDERTLLIDQEIGREENSIRHLQEFRQSLIHEVVTGKMDVRGVVTS